MMRIINGRGSCWGKGGGLISLQHLFLLQVKYFEEATTRARLKEACYFGKDMVCTVCTICNLCCLLFALFFRNIIYPLPLYRITKTNFPRFQFFFSFSSHTSKSYLTEPATTIVQSFTPRRCVAFDPLGRPVLENKFLDRKFASRWVLLSEGDEGGMSMTGYISVLISRLMLRVSYCCCHFAMLWMCY